MPKQILFCLDDSERTRHALRNLGTLLEPADAHLHLFHAAPETSHFYPGELSTLSGEPGQWQKAQESRVRGILEQAATLLLDLGFKRPRIDQEATLKSVNAAQDILAASEGREPGAIVLARKGRSAVKRFFLGSTTAVVCQYAEKLPVWVVGSRSLQPPHILVALDGSHYGWRIVSHLGEYFGGLPGVRLALFHIMPAKPPGYWDDGHILDESERSERQQVVGTWRAAYEQETEDLFLKAKSHLVGAGVSESNIYIKRQTLVDGIARDILAEARVGDYNILAFGRRGTSAIKEFALGSRAAKMLYSPTECSLILVS
ncbi:MAG: universal stress protein [Hyphomicrobiales bacterium]